MPGPGFPTAWRGANWKVAGSAFYRASALAGAAGGYAEARLVACAELGAGAVQGGAGRGGAAATVRHCPRLPLFASPIARVRWCACPCPPTQYTLPPGTLSHRRTGGLSRHHALHMDVLGSARPTTLLPPAGRPSSPDTHTLAHPHTRTLGHRAVKTGAHTTHSLRVTGEQLRRNPRIVLRNTGALLGPLRPTLFRVLAVVVRRLSPSLKQVLQQAVQKRASLQGRNVLFSMSAISPASLTRRAGRSAPGLGLRRGCVARRGACRVVRFASLRVGGGPVRWANHAGGRAASGGSRSRRLWSERFE